MGLIHLAEICDGSVQFVTIISCNCCLSLVLIFKDLPFISVNFVSVFISCCDYATELDFGLCT